MNKHILVLETILKKTERGGRELFLTIWLVVIIILSSWSVMELEFVSVESADVQILNILEAIVRSVK